MLLRKVGIYQLK